MVNIFGRIFICVKILKVLILVKIFGKYQFWSQFSKMSILVKNFKKSRFREIFQTILIFAKIFNNLAFVFQNFKEKYIVFFFQNSRKIFFSLNIRKSRLLSKYWKLSWSLSQFLIISYLIKFSVILILEKSRFSSIFSKNLDFGQNFWILDFIQNFRKVWILVQCFVSLDFCQNFWKSPLWSKFTKISTLV